MLLLKGFAGGIVLLLVALTLWIANVVRNLRQEHPGTAISFSSSVFLQRGMFLRGFAIFVVGFAITLLLIARRR
jgi:hypothetical protein